MKKNLFTIMALVIMMFVPQFAWADLSEVYNLTTTGGLGTAGTATETETPYTKGSTSYAVNTLDANLWTAGATDDDPWTIQGVGQYIKVTVANNFDAGDQIVIKGKGNGSFRIFDNATGSTGSDANAFEQAMNKNTEAEYTLTLGADNLLIGKNTFYLRWSSGSNAGSLYFIKVNQDPTATKYNVTIADGIEHGTVTANATSVRAGVEVTLTAVPDDDYELETLTVQQGNTEVTVTGGKFIMPAGDVTISATFKEVIIPDNQVYKLTTTGNFGTGSGSKGADNPFTKNGITYTKSGLNNESDTHHSPMWWQNKSTSTYLGCTLPRALAVGDTIAIVARATASSQSIYLRDTSAVKNASNEDTQYIAISTTSGEDKEYRYTIQEGDILVGDSTFYVMQNKTSSLYFKYVQVLADTTSITQKAHNITIADGIENGTVTSKRTKAVYGAMVTLTVTPATGYELDALTISPSTDGDSDTPTYSGAPRRAPSIQDTIAYTKIDDTHYLFAMPDANVTVTATFKNNETAKTLTVTKEWTVFCSPETFAVPEGLKAYTISAVTQPTAAGGNGTVTLKEQSIIAQGVPMILQNTAIGTTTSFTLASSTGTIAAADQDSHFKGSATGTTAMSSSNTNYVLKGGNFVRSTATQAAQYSCFLEFTAAAAASAPRYSITIGGGTTGISTLGVATLEEDGQWYNLNGVRVAQPTQKGIYIRNGKKMVIK